jgi:hypothetical protein
MLKLVYPHAPNVFGDLREELGGRCSSFFESIEETIDSYAVLI